MEHSVAERVDLMGREAQREESKFWSGVELDLSVNLAISYLRLSGGIGLQSPTLSLLICTMGNSLNQLQR